MSQNNDSHDRDNHLVIEVENPVDLKLHEMIETKSKKESLHLSKKMESYLTLPLSED